MSYYLIYAQENVHFANQFLSFFEGTQIIVETNPNPITFEAQLENTKENILVFICDDLLKSQSIMECLIALLQDNSKKFLTVLVDSRRQKNDNPGEFVNYPTKINSIHEVMQYRDFWYEEWIRLNKLCNSSNGVDLIELEHQKEVAKSISTNIGAFLRKINHLQPISWEQFSADGFKYFLDKAELQIPEQEIELLAEQKETVKEILSESIVDFTQLVTEKEGQHSAKIEITETIEEEEKVESFVLFDLIEKKPEIVETPLILGVYSEKESGEENVIALELTTNIGNMDNLKNSEEQKGIDKPISDEPKTVHSNPEEMNNPDLLFYLAESAAEEVDFQLTRQCYQRILKLEPMNGRALIWLARIINNHFDGESALVDDLYKKAMFCNEETDLLFYEYGVHLSKNFESYHRAADMLQRAIDLNPAFDLAYLELANCQYKLGQNGLAKSNYLQACLISNENRTAEADLLYSVYNPVPISAEEDEVLAQPIKHPNEDTVVMVTGATSGIGRAVAELFALNGYKVIITGRRADRLEEIKSELASRYPLQLETLCFDVRDFDSVNNALKELPEAWRDVDILINNAGLAKGRSPFHLGNLDHWETMIDTNIKGLLYVTRAISPRMVERGTGFIINIGSVAGKEAYTDGNVYCATKAAVDMLTKGLRLDLHKHGIRVSAVHPGHVETEFALVRFDGDEQKANIYENFTPLTPMDVAETIYYIATRPAHVNIQDVLMFSTQQASATVVDMSGKKYKD